MGQMKSTTWIGGAVLLSLVILAMAWFLGASPAFDEAALANEEADAAEQRNSQLRATNAQLKREFEDLPSLQAELASLREEIPEDLLLSDLNETIGTVATARSVTVLSVAVEPAVEVLPLAPDPAAATVPAEDEAATAPSVEGVAGLYAVPVTVGVLGTYENVVAVLDDLQQGANRIYSVHGLQILGQDEKEASGGRPATAAGDAEQTITGYVYVLRSPEAGAPVAEDATAASAPVN